MSIKNFVFQCIEKVRNHSLSAIRNPGVILLLLVSLVSGIALPFLHNLKASTKDNNKGIKLYNQSSNVKKPSTGKQKPKADSTCLVKGKVNAKGAKTYHLPGGMFYSRTKATECFKTETEAQAAGYSRSPK